MLEIKDKKGETKYVVYENGVCYNCRTGGDVPQYVLAIGREYAKAHL